jgi:integrase
LTCSQRGHAFSKSAKVINVLLHLKNEGYKYGNGKRRVYSLYTLKNISKALKFLAKHCDLDNPENVKRFIANYNTSDSYKRNLSIAYNHYVQYHGLTWEMPLYKPAEKRPRIPTEEKINMIISASPFKLAVKLSISKETGLRPIEVMNLRVRDIDLEKGLVYPATAKHGSGRVLKLSSKTLDMVKALIAKENLGLNDKLFKGNGDNYGKQFRRIRNEVAKKLSDPSIKSIRLYDLRHFYATMLYHKTRDILFVKEKMGHKKLETTLIYTQLIDFGDDEYHVKTAKTVEEACALVEQGFEYVTEMEGVKIFRKRK